MNKKLLVILLFAFLIRLISLNQSLWLDEATTARVINEYSYTKILTEFSPHDFHPPLYYLFMKFWTDIFGYSEISLRFPSIMFSLITGWTIYLIGKQIKDKKIGLWASSLFLFNPLIIYYSQEARMYSLITMLIALIVYYLLVLRSSLERNGVANSKLTGPVKKSFPTSARSTLVALRAVGSPLFFTTRQLIFCNFFIFLSFLTFYGSIFFIFSIYLYLLIKKEFKLFWYLLPGFLFSFILISPLLYQQYINSKIALSSVANWSLVLGKVNIKNLLLIPIKFSIGRISFEPKIFYYLISGLWTSYLFSFILRPKTNLRGLFFLWLFFTPLIIGLIFSFFSPLLQYFRFIYLISVMTILISLNSNKVWQKYIVLFGFIIFSLIYLLNSQYHREDWKNLVFNLNNKEPVYMVVSSSDPIKYYNKKIDIKDIKKIDRYFSKKKLTIIPYTTDIHGIDYKSVLEKSEYKLAVEKSYRGLKIESWTKK